MNRLATAIGSALLCTACATPVAPGPGATGPDEGDPARAEVPLASPSDWRAALMLDNDATGIWTLGVLQVFPQYACPEVVGLDDRGRCHVMVSYSGKWTPVTTIADGAWLGGLAQGDVDPRVPGTELYTGGKRGNLYQVVSHREGLLDNRLIASLPGRELHTLVAADLDPGKEGDELLAFTRPGGLFLLTPRTDLDGFDVELIAELEGRVRDAAWIPWRRQVATVERSGRLSLLTWTETGPAWETIFERPMGMGRLDIARIEGRTVIYSTCDDGTIWRHGERTGGEWDHELIYAGPQGPRGITAGRFAADAATETVAVFGYSRRVELLTRTPVGWDRQLLFEDLDKGHWLTSGELDGRNATEELVLSGYGARMVLLSRPPGYGLGCLATE